MSCTITHRPHRYVHAPKAWFSTITIAKCDNCGKEWGTDEEWTNLSPNQRQETQP